MEQACAVCKSIKGTLHKCPLCSKPCHTKCSGKKKGPCNNCRSTDHEPQKSSPPSSLPQPRTTAVRQTRASILRSSDKSPQQQQVFARTSLPPRRSSSSTSTTSSASKSSQSQPRKHDIATSMPVSSAPVQPLMSCNSEPASDSQARNVSSIEGAKTNYKKEAAAQASSGVNHTVHNDNFMIPVSTLDLIFQHFNSLQDRLDAIESHMGREIEATRARVTESPAKLGLSEDAVSRFSALEGLIKEQNAQLGELRIDRQLLLDENAHLKGQIAELKSDLKIIKGGVESAPRNRTSPPESVAAESGSRQLAASGDLTTPSLVHVGNREVILHGIVKDIGTPAPALLDISFAALATLQPSLEKSEILNVRILPSRGKPRRETDADIPVNGDASCGPPSCVVTLESPRIVHAIIRAKRSTKFNYFSTGDINPSLLSPEVVSHVPNRKILINEMLPRDCFETFRSLRPVARSLGFRYIWHAGDRFLVRRKGGKRAYIFTSAADLQALASVHTSVLPNVDTGSGDAADSRGKKWEEGRSRDSGNEGSVVKKP